MKSANYNYPPLVPRWISIRNALRMVQNPIPILSENVEMYGKSYTFHIGGMQKGIVTIEPEFIQHILQKNHRNYRKSEMQTHILGHYVGKGLLTSDGAFWLRQRRLIQPAFHRERLDRIMSIMIEEIDDFLSTQWTGSSTKDIYSEMHRLAFRIVAKALFSADISDDVLLTLSQQITEIQHFVTRRIRQPYLHYWFKVSGKMQSHDRLADGARRILLNIIQERKTQDVQSNDLLDLLLGSRYEDTGEPMDERQVLDESLIIFVAGHETTANALTWILYLLTQHPGWTEAIRDEHDTEPTGLMDVMRRSATRQVIEEAMRLYPPAWIIDRLPNTADEILGFRYPKDTFLIQYIYGVHRDPDLWPDPERFDPERFGEEGKKQHVPYSYLPFGGGPRLCIGNQFAVMEMILALGQIVKRYDLTLVGEHPEMRPMVTLRPKGKVMMRVEKRQGQD